MRVVHQGSGCRGAADHGLQRSLDDNPDSDSPVTHATGRTERTRNEQRPQHQRWNQDVNRPTDVAEDSNGLQVAPAGPVVVEPDRNGGVEADIDAELIPTARAAKRVNNPAESRTSPTRPRTASAAARNTAATTIRTITGASMPIIVNQSRAGGRSATNQRPHRTHTAVWPG